MSANGEISLMEAQKAIFGELKKNWGWLLAFGILSIVLGGMILAKWPWSGLWVIGMFVAIELIFNGWSYVFVALAARKAGQSESVGTGAAGAAA